MDSLRVDLEDVVLAEKVRIEPLGHTHHRIANDYWHGCNRPTIAASEG
jgi:hypothetical protein